MGSEIGMLILLSLGVLATGAPGPAKDSTPPPPQLKAVPRQQPASCDALLTAAGASASGKFGGNVGHALHSISLADLQRFEPATGPHNRVPTVNPDLRSPIAVLDYAPDLRGPDHDKFVTEGMQMLDQVLPHMDDKQWDVGGYMPLERVVHALHMREFWARARAAYLPLKATPLSNETCACALDGEANGLMATLRFVALAIREPDLVYPHQTSSTEESSVAEAKSGKSASWSGNIYKYNFFTPDAKPEPENKKAASSDGKIYTYRFRTPDAKDAPVEAAKNQKTASWDGNIYKYRFLTPDTKDAPAQDIKPENDANWSGNIYKYNFFTPDAKPDESRHLTLGDFLKANSVPQPRLRSAADWPAWKAMLPPAEMKAAAADTALFLHCALRPQ